MPLAYRSQRVAEPYFIVALALFVLQVAVGIWLAVSYAFTVPQWLVDLVPFSATRAVHTNLLVLWLLLGFMGATYFVVPEEAEREIYSTRLAYAQLALLVGTGVTAVAGFLLGWTKGKPLLEIPHPLDYLVVAGALMFLFNVGMTMLRARRHTAIQGALLAGLVFLAVMYLFNLPFYPNLTIDWYYWWWVIHLWVEGAWELVAAALTAWILLKVTGVPRETVEKWLYVELGLFLFTGIAGTGHHYYWLGAPKYWLWVGGIFSALEPLPIVLMLVDTLRYLRGSRPATGRLVFTLATGMAVLHLVGAGLWGLLHTLPPVNYYTHGSQVTVAHGHLAFFGAYVLLNLMFFYYAMPRLRGLAAIDERRGTVAFWWMSLSVLGMTLAFSAAGLLQTYLERVMGLGYMTAQAQMRVWFGVVALLGLSLLGSVVLTTLDLLRLRPALAATAGLLVLLLAAPAPARAHCDSLDGPVVRDARLALQSGEAAIALKWVPPEGEAEVRAAFEQARAVRILGSAAQELADRYFFETLVRVHRRGEGEAYTGLRPAGAEFDQAIRAADRALETQSVDGLARTLAVDVDRGLRARFERVLEARRQTGLSLDHGRAFVAAYTDFVHYVERVGMTVEGGRPEHESEAPPRH